MNRFGNKLFEHTCCIYPFRVFYQLFSKTIDLIAHRQNVIPAIEQCRFIYWIYHLNCPPYKEEKGYFVKGLHEPLISERLFADVQDVLDGRKKEIRPKTFKPTSLYIIRLKIGNRFGHLATHRIGRFE